MIPLFFFPSVLQTETHGPHADDRRAEPGEQGGLH
jgi:hypothetical protein